VRGPGRRQGACR